MKAKYLFRGFGLGVIITAVVMGAYTRSAVADARVNVLKEYGIGEEAVLAETLVDIGGNDDNDMQKNADDMPEVVPFDDPTAVQSNELTPETVPQGEIAPDAAASPETAAQGDAADSENVPESGNVIVIEPSDDIEVKENGDTITVVISSGDDSGTVARKLHSAGLVDNAAEFDAFLIQHGYDKKMREGTKIININDSWQEIADKISRY